MLNVKPQVVIATLALALAYGTPALAHTSENSNPSWVLKPAISPLPNWYEVRGGTWRVPKDIVEEMAARIKGEMGSQ